MKESKDNERFLQQLESTLDQSAEALDDATLRDLRNARRKAVTASEKRPAAWLLPVSGLATAATVAVFSVSLWMPSPQPGMDAQLSPLEDLALLGDSESLEFYEDLDFYLWLDDENQSG